MAIRAVLFDLFDTLVDLDMAGLPRVKVGDREFPTTAGALHAHVAARAPLSLEDFVAALYATDEALRTERYGAGRELPTLERFQALAERLELTDPDLPRLLTETHMALLRGQVGLLGHHAPLLAELGRRLRLGVCSNFSHSQTALAILEEAGLRWHLDAVLVSDAIGYRKPRPEIFTAALSALGTAPEETLHVGDSLRADVAGAAALGIRTAWITRCVRDPAKALAEHEGPRPDLVVADLAELAEHLADGEPLAREGVSLPPGTQECPPSQQK